MRMGSLVRSSRASCVVAAPREIEAVRPNFRVQAIGKLTEEFGDMGGLGRSVDRLADELPEFVFPAAEYAHRLVSVNCFFRKIKFSLTTPPSPVKFCSVQG